MDLARLHPEDVKAGLKKRYRTVAAFERQAGLPEKSVFDVLRGRASARVTAAIETALSKPLPQARESEFSDNNTGDAAAQLLQCGGALDMATNAIIVVRTMPAPLWAISKSSRSTTRT